MRVAHAGKARLPFFDQQLFKFFQLVIYDHVIANPLRTLNKRAIIVSLGKTHPVTTNSDNLQLLDERKPIIFRNRLFSRFCISKIGNQRVSF